MSFHDETLKARHEDDMDDDYGEIGSMGGNSMEEDYDEEEEESIGAESSGGTVAASEGSSASTQPAPSRAAKSGGAKKKSAAKKKASKKKAQPRARKRSAKPPPPKTFDEFTHTDKIMFPEAGITKGQVLEYYDRIAERLLPYLRDRPATLERLPDGLAGPHAPHDSKRRT